MPNFIQKSLRRLKDEWNYRRKIKWCSYKFVDRKQDKKEVLIILAGYKPYLFKDVFSRVKNFAPPRMDICIVSSGLYSDELANIAQKNNWSYLSIQRNSVSLAQNIAILLHPSAEFIYKMDEDIFLTENCLELMMKTYKKVEQDGLYDISFVAPLIPINGYAHVRILDKLGLSKLYANKFEKVKYAAYSTRKIEKDPAVAKFFWGEGGYVPSIDELASKFGKEQLSYTACPIRFSIGCILLKRATWEHMGMWRVAKHGAGMGLDEEQICQYAIANSQAIIVSENAIAGHLSFGQQNNDMRKYYMDNPDIFKCPSKGGY